MKNPKKRLAMIGIGCVLALGLPLGVGEAAHATLLRQDNVSCAASGNYYISLYSDHAVSRKGTFGNCGGWYYVKMAYEYNGSRTYWTDYVRHRSNAEVYPPYSPVTQSKHKMAAPRGVVTSLP